MRYTLLKFMMLLSLIPLTLSGCGSSSSSSRHVDATDFPFGAEGFAIVIDEDGNGIPEMTTEVSFSYNRRMQVTSYSKITDDYDSSSEKVVDREVEETVIDPRITPLNGGGIPTSVFQASLPSAENGLGGAVISRTISRYGFDEEGEALYPYPSYQRIEQFSYNSAGYLTGMDHVRSYDNDDDGIFDEIRNYIYTYTYDADNRPTSRAYANHYDSNGDGLNNSSSLEATTYSYDSHGNLVSIVYTEESDNDGDGVYEDTDSSTTTIAHTYSDGLLRLSIVTQDDETPWQIEYDYDNQGRLLTITESHDNYSGGDPYDTFVSHSYEYDSGGNLLTHTYDYQSDSSRDGLSDYRQTWTYTWTYNNNNLVTSYLREYRNYSDPVTATLSSHDSSERTYDYDENGNLSLYAYKYTTDSTLDGNLDRIEYEYEYIYNYNAEGYLAGYDYFYYSYDSNGHPSGSETGTQTISYTDGVLTGAEWVESYNGSESRETFSLNYDENGRIISYLSEYDEDNDEAIDSTRGVDLTYNGTESVTFSMLEDEMEYSRMEVNFDTIGIPDGTAELILSSRTIETPTVMDFNSRFTYMSDTDNKIYPIKEKIPKILHFIYFEQYLGGGIK